MRQSIVGFLLIVCFLTACNAQARPIPTDFQSSATSLPGPTSTLPSSPIVTAEPSLTPSLEPTTPPGFRAENGSLIDRDGKEVTDANGNPIEAVNVRTDPETGWVVALDGSGNLAAVLTSDSKWHVGEYNALVTDDQVWLWNPDAAEFEQPDYLIDVSAKRVVIDENFVTIKRDTGMPGQVFDRNGQAYQINYDRFRVGDVVYRWFEQGRGIWKEMPKIEPFVDEDFREDRMTNAFIQGYRWGGINANAFNSEKYLRLDGAFAGYRLEADERGNLTLSVYLVLKNRIIRTNVGYVQQIQSAENNLQTGKNYPLRAGGLTTAELTNLRQELESAVAIDNAEFTLYKWFPSGQSCKEGFPGMPDMDSCMMTSRFPDTPDEMKEKIAGAYRDHRQDGVVIELDQVIGDGISRFDLPK